MLTDLNLQRLYQQHIDGGRLAAFREKPSVHYLVSMGVYVVNRRILDRVPAGKRYGFDNLMLDMLARREDVHVEQHEGYWLDIGREDDYLQAIDDFERRRSQLIPDA